MRYNLHPGSRVDDVANGDGCRGELPAGARLMRRHDARPNSLWWPEDARSGGRILPS